MCTCVVQLFSPERMTVELVNFGLPPIHGPTAQIVNNKVRIIHIS